MDQFQVKDTRSFTNLLGFGDNTTQLQIDPCDQGYKDWSYLVLLVDGSLRNHFIFLESSLCHLIVSHPPSHFKYRIYCNENHRIAAATAFAVGNIQGEQHVRLSCRVSVDASCLYL
jgi:hypothetical protein